MCSGFSQWYHWSVTFVSLVLPFLSFAPISLPMIPLVNKIGIKWYKCYQPMVPLCVVQSAEQILDWLSANSTLDSSLQGDLKARKLLGDWMSQN